MTDRSNSQSIIVRGDDKGPVLPLIYRFVVTAGLAVQQRLGAITISLDITPKKDTLRVRAWSPHWLTRPRIFTVRIESFPIVGSQLVNDMVRAILAEIVANPLDWDDTDRAIVDHILKQEAVRA